MTRLGVRRRVGKALRRLQSSFPAPDERWCVFCERPVRGFLPYRGGSADRPALMKALETVGSDVDNFQCPECGAHDRERHLLLYMRAAGVLERLPGARVLHIAPETQLRRRIAAARPAEYVLGDLAPVESGIARLDLMDLALPDESFTLLIANHVLEHVADERKALAEILRVLAPGGYAILQTPYSPKLRRTWSDPGIDTAAARRQAFGQEDHIRLFGVDIFDAICAVGLESCVASHEELLPGIDPRKMGVNHAEPFFLFRRPT